MTEFSIGSTRNIKVLTCPKPAVLRKGYDGLFALARDQLKQDPLSGHAFLFVSRNRQRCKVFYLDDTGLCILMNRLEKGHSSEPWDRCAGNLIELEVSEFGLFLKGSTMVFRTTLSPRAVMPAPIQSHVSNRAQA